VFLYFWYGNILTDFIFKDDMFKKTLLSIALLCAFQGFYVEAGKFKPVFRRDTHGVHNDGPYLRKSGSALVAWQENGGYGKKKKPSSNPQGTGVLLMDAIVDGDMELLDKRVTENRDPVFIEHLTAMKLKVRGIQEKIDWDKLKYGEDSSLGRQSLEERRGLFNGALSLLHKYSSGYSDRTLQGALRFLQKNQSKQMQKARRTRESR
jgi:hypothetical protein